METLLPQPVPADDEALLRAFLERNDRQALGALFARHADAAYRLALRLTRNSADAEDAVQAAFIEVLRRAARYRGEATVKAWVLGFVVNSCRHKSREEGRRAAREERAAVPEGRNPADRGVEDAVRGAVQELPDPYRAPVWLHYCEGLTSGEVAEALSLSENTVRSQLSRGVEQLRGALAGAGVAVSASGVVAALSAAAIETAPASLTTSLAGLASQAIPATGGVAAKVAAGSVAFAAIVSTAAFLGWGGTPEEVRPPDLAWIEERVREWQPTAEERRWDEVGWAPSLREALRLGRELRRPAVAITLSGPVQRGRSDGGSLSLRAGPLSDPRVIALLNGRCVPVYYENREEGVDPDERKARRRLYQDAAAAGLLVGTEVLYVVGADGRVADTLHMCKATSDLILDRVGKAATGIPDGKPAVAPGPQSYPSEDRGLVLHLTSRYLDKEGRVEARRGSYHEFPAEAWLSVDPASLLPAELGGPREIDAARLFSHFYPVTGNFRDPSTNPIAAASLSARIETSGRRIAWVRLEGRVTMTHFFHLDKDAREVEAPVVGYLAWDKLEKRVRSLRMATDRATYGKENFGVAVRSVP